MLGASSLGFVVMYPFMKRITYYPQIFFCQFYILHFPFILPTLSFLSILLAPTARR